MNRVVYTLTTVVFACGYAFGQEKPVPETDPLKCYGPFIGTWCYNGPLLEDVPGVAEKGASSVGDLYWRWTLNKNAIESSVNLKVIDGKTAYADKVLFGWNAKERAITFSGVAQDGTLLRGSVDNEQAPRVLIESGEGITSEGKPISFKVAIKKVNRDTLTLQALERTGGAMSGPSPVYTYKRVKRPEPPTDSIPEKVLKEIGFMVGDWETELTANGVTVGTATHERRWATGSHCLRMTWKSIEDGAPVNAFGISGWNADTEQVIEHWYDSLGRYSSVQWPLAKMNQDAWEGTSSRTYADGKVEKGRCRLEKGDGRWIFTISGEKDGEAIAVKNITRKIN